MNYTSFDSSAAGRQRQRCLAQWNTLISLTSEFLVRLILNLQDSSYNGNLCVCQVKSSILCFYVELFFNRIR